MKFLALLPIAIVLIAGCTASQSPPTGNGNPPVTPPPTPPTGNGHGITPEVIVSSQSVSDGTAIVEDVVSEGSGWITIHADNNGAPGAVIGQSPVTDGENHDVQVSIDLSLATSTLYAMLHTDAGEAGVYEFPGPDTPVSLNGDIVMTPFSASGLGGTPSPPPPPASQVREFTVTASQFQFEPSTITVNKGDRVKLTITSQDVTHGFSITEYNINKVLSPNQPVVVEFTADQAGTFTMFCSVVCGSGHSGMRGTLIVEE